MRAELAVAGCIAMAMPTLGFAQSDSNRLYVSVNGGVQISDNAVNQSFNVQKNFEDAPITADIDEKRGTLFDGGVLAALTRHFGVGVAVSVLTNDTNADVAARIPHPFFFRQLRDVSGTTDTTRRETAAHVEVAYLMPGRRLQLIVFGGPSFFSVRQTLVTDVTYSESYPFDTATFTGAQTMNATKRATGFHAGFDVAWRFLPHAGIGGLVRYGRASATLDVADRPDVKIDVGGLQVGAGLRLAF